MASTSLHSSKSVPPSSDSGSDKSQPAHGLFFQEIIKDSMDYSSLQDFKNPEFKRLCGSASSLAATALAPTTTGLYGRAWGRFMGYCSQMGFDPLEVSGPVVATW